MAAAAGTPSFAPHDSSHLPVSHSAHGVCVESHTKGGEAIAERRSSWNSLAVAREQRTTCVTRELRPCHPYVRHRDDSKVSTRRKRTLNSAHARWEFNHVSESFASFARRIVDHHVVNRSPRRWTWSLA